MTDDEIRQENLALMQQYQTLLLEHRFDEWIDLWADDANPRVSLRCPGSSEDPGGQGDNPRLHEGLSVAVLGRGCR